MFEELEHYPREKVKLFMRYLVNAAAKQKSFEAVDRVPEPVYSNIELEKRMSELNEDRREELETKIKAYYTKNRYMPLFLRLRKIRQRYNEVKKTGGNRKKLLLLKQKIEKCHSIIKKMQRLDQLRENLAAKSY